MRVHLQNLQNSRVNHKDVLIRHENQTKKLIELVNDISEKQNEHEMERTRMDSIKAKRFSTFEARGRRARAETLYDFDERSGSGSGGRYRQHTRRVHSSPVDSRERRSSSVGTTRRQSEFWIMRKFYENKIVEQQVCETFHDGKDFF